MRLTLTVARAATDRALFQVIPTVFPFNPEGLAFLEPVPPEIISRHTG